MKNLILKVLKEETEMSEMGMRFSKVKTSQPSNYLVRSLSKKEKGLEKKEKLKEEAVKCNELYIEIRSDLKNLNWRDIKFVRNNDEYKVVFPEQINYKLKTLSKLFEKVEKNLMLMYLNPEDRIAEMVNDYKYTISKKYIKLQVEYNRNRTHFPDGLPFSLLGLGLGYKIYRKILSILGFIQSESDASEEVQEIYRKLIESPETNCILYKEGVIILDRQLDKNKVEWVVMESIKQIYDYLQPIRKLILGKEIIVNSGLIKIVGEKKIKRFMDEVYEKHEYGDLLKPFENI